MRILHVITSLRTGGAERLVAELAPRIAARGHEVELLLFDGTPTPLREAVEKHGIRVHELGRGVFQMWNPLHLFRLRKYLKNGRFDIVHTHNTPCQLLTAIAAPGRRPILVTTEHNTHNRRRGWRWYGAVDRWMYGRYDRIICVGEQTQSNLTERLGGSFAAKTVVVPNGIDLERFTSAKRDDTLRGEDERGKRIVIMVSAFRAQKDQPTLIRAMRHLPDDYRLWLVGDWTLRASCERLAEESGVSGRVRFWGLRSDIPELLASADVAVLSSHYEGMSLSSIEGMASGKPFIASDVDGLRETVGGAGLLFPHGDDRRLAELIRAVAEDGAFGAEVASRCRERAMLYDIERVADQYVGIYNELTSNNY